MHLVGHSYGGFAAYCAAKNPELIRSLILVDPAASTILIKDPKNPVQFLSLLLTKPSTALSAAKFTTKSLNIPLGGFVRLMRLGYGAQIKRGWHNEQGWSLRAIFRICT